MNFKIDNSLTCPSCHGSNFEIKQEATYVYTYNVNSKVIGIQDEIIECEKSPYTFDNREQVSENKFIICKDCGESYSFFIDKIDGKVTITLI